MHAGVLNVVPGDRDAGAHLIAHPGVHKVAFTGSTQAGQQIGEVCGRLLRPVTLELGGKSAALIADDADLDDFASHLLEVSLPNNGQTCHASTRILAPHSRFDEVVAAVTDTVRALLVGDPLVPDTAVGPLVSDAQRQRVLGYIGRGRSTGLTITTGGAVPAAQPRGWFVEPTVFADVPNHAPLAQEEIFGPVLTITRYTDDNHAVALANDSLYGLGGTIWTQDTDRGIAMATQIHSGTVGVNHYALDLNAPFGGVKNSGLGRELGPEGLRAYLIDKSIYLAAGATPSTTSPREPQ
jgi:aldehyde dehydrogenase (NAD+)